MYTEGTNLGVKKNLKKKNNKWVFISKITAEDGG